MISKELSDVDIFFVEFEKLQEKLRKKDIPLLVTDIAKDVRGWFTVIRIRPND